MNNKINLECLPARASSARAGFHSVKKRGESMSNKKYNCYTIAQYVESIAGAKIWQYITKKDLQNAYIANEFAQQQ